MKKQYAVFLVLASFVIIALAAVAGSGSSVSDLPAPPAIGTVIDSSRPSVQSRMLITIAWRNWPRTTKPKV